MINRVELIKGMLPNAIVRTPRDTYVYTLDGEDQAFPTFKSAAVNLAKSLGLGEKHVTSEEVSRRVKAQAVNAEALQKAPPAPPVAPAAPAPSTERPQRRNGQPAKQQRSIAVELPQAVISDLLRGGRSKIILRVKAR